MNIIMMLDNCFDPDVRVYKEAKYLVDQGNSVEIVCLDKKNKYIDKENEIVDGIKIHRIFCRTQRTTKLIEKGGIFSLFKAFIYAYWLIKFFMQAKRYVKQKQADMIHCHDIVMAYGARWFFSRNSKVFDMHEYYLNDDNSMKDAVMNHMVKSAQKHSQWIIYVNEKQILRMDDRNKHKLIMLPNYPSVEIFDDTEKTQSDKPRIAYVGAVRDFRSLKALIDINQLMSDRCDIKIYGYGSAYDECKHYEQTQGYESVMMGSYNGINEIQEIYKNTDILYCVYDNRIANWKTSYPVKFYEGIITKTPMIVSKGSAVGTFVEEYDIGYTVDLNDFEGMKNIFSEMLSNAEAYNQKMIHIDSLKDQFTWENKVSVLDNIYSN